MSVWRHIFRYAQRFTSFSQNANLFLLSGLLSGLGFSIAWLLLNFYLQSLKYDQTFIGLVNALPSLSLVIVGLPIGFSSDRIGRKSALLIGQLLGFGSLLGLALFGQASALILFSLLGGLASAFSWSNAAPFMMENSSDHDRTALFTAQQALFMLTGFFGNIFGGQLPALFGTLIDSPPEAVLALRLTLIVSATLTGLAVLPLLLLCPSNPALSHSASDDPASIAIAKQERAPLISDPALWIKLLLPTLLISLGAGQVMPFLNIYIEGKFHISFELLGALFAWTSLGTALAMLLQPLLAERVGKIQSVIIVQAASIPFLLILGFVPIFWLVAPALFIRNALMNMSNPIYSALCMELISSRERAAFSSANNIIWSLGWAIGPAFSGWWREQAGFTVGFNTVFTLMTALYVISILLLYVFFARGRAES